MQDQTTRITADSTAGTALIVGATRGLGLAIAAELVARRWSVIATARSGGRTPLHELADRQPDRLSIEILDMNEPDQIAALRDRLAGRPIDILLVSAGITTQDEHVGIGQVSTEEFARVMVTNALSPMRAIEALEDLVPKEGLIAAMSSGQGSIANNVTGMREVYRGSKAALNMLMRSFAAHEANDLRPMLLIAPGWIRTDLGGPEATFSLEESIPKLVDLLMSKRARPGLEYLDRDGRTVPW